MKIRINPEFCFNSFIVDADYIPAKGADIFIGIKEIRPYVMDMKALKGVHVDAFFEWLFNLEPHLVLTVNSDVAFSIEGGVMIPELIVTPDIDLEGELDAFLKEIG